jgi:DMSO/TMAO reductase YedYZ molybdopterin-dependent catalytic subunit
MLIPDIYGMKNAKWVTSITLIDTEYEGFWQRQGWDNVARIKTQSAITFPADGDQIKTGQLVTLKGIAFAGARGLKKVEVSTDNGTTWNEVTVKPALSDTSWALWRIEWNVPPPANKSYILKVRATDGTGVLQDSEDNPPFPDGASGYHTISVNAA